MGEQEPDAAKADGPDDEYALASSAEAESRLEPTLPPGCSLELPEAVEAPRERFQFTLSELLLLLSAASFLLSVISTVLKFVPGGVPAKNFAGLMGLGALVSMVLMARFPPRRAIVRVGWWTLLLLYLLACAIALLKG
jgi:hypothetical protein